MPETVKGGEDDQMNYETQHEKQAEKAKVKKFRTAQVKVNLISEHDFETEGIKVNVIAFTEIETASDLGDNNENYQNPNPNTNNNNNNLATLKATTKSQRQQLKEDAES